MSKKVRWTILSILPNNVLRPIRVGNIIGLALAAVCSLGAGEAAAQHCPDASVPRANAAGFNLFNTVTMEHRDISFTREQRRNLYSFFPRPASPPTEQVYCLYTHAEEDNDRVIFLRNPSIFITDDDFDPGIYAVHGGRGDLSVYMHALGATLRDGATRPHPDGEIHPHPLDYGKHAVRSRPAEFQGTGEFLHGVHAKHTGEGRVGIDFRNLSLSTTGNHAYGIFAQQEGGYTFENGMTRRNRGAVIINVIETDRDRGSRVRPMIATRGDSADVIRAAYTRASSYGHIAVTVEGYTIAAGGIVPTDETALRPVYSLLAERPITDLQGQRPVLPSVPLPGISDRRLSSLVESFRDFSQWVAFFSGVSSEKSRGIYAQHEGLGDIRIRTTDSIIMTWGENSEGIYGTHTGRPITVREVLAGGRTSTTVTTGGGEVSINVRGGSILTQSESSHGVLGLHRGVGGVDIDLTGASVATVGPHARGVFGWIRRCLGTIDSTQCDVERARNTLIEGSGVGDIAIDVTGGSSIVTAGRSAYAVQARHENKGDIAIRLTGSTTAMTRATTKGEGAYGVFADHRGTEGNVAVTLNAASIVTEGNGASALLASRAGGTGSVAVTVAGSTVETMGETANGVSGIHTGTGDLGIDVSASAVSATGEGVYGLHRGTGNIAIDVQGGSITTTGIDANGVLGFHTGTGNLGIDVSDSSITTTGTGVLGRHVGDGNLVINVQGGSITTTGPDANTRYASGVYGTHTGTGTLAINVRGASITAMGDGGGDGIRASISNEDDVDVDVQVTVDQGSSVRGARFGVRVFVEETEGTTTTGGTGAGVRSAGLGALAVAGMDSAVPSTHGGGHFRLINHGSITGGEAGVWADVGSRVENYGTIAGEEVGVSMGAGSRIENQGTIAGEQVGVRLGAGSRVENYGTIAGEQVGVRLGAGSHIENQGTITGKIPIQIGSNSRGVFSGLIRSADGPNGFLFHFGPGANTLEFQRVDDLIGRYIQGVSDDDDSPPDLSVLRPDQIRILTFLDDTGTPKWPKSLTETRLPTERGVGQLIRFEEAGKAGTLLGLDTTVFALTDDMLSDLTGSIHAAVIGNGLQAHAGEGDPARNRVWAAPFGGAREQNGAGRLADGTHYFGGGMLGADWGTATRVGLFVGGSVGQLDVMRVPGDGTGSRRTIDMQTVFGGVYARQELGDVLLDARVVMGRMDHDSTRRDVRSGAANVEYTSIFLSPEVGAATRIQLMSRLHATPRLRVRYAGLFTEGFRERDWDVQFAKRDVHVLEARGGVGIPIALHAGGRIEPRVGVEGRWLAGGDTIDIAVDGVSRVVDAGGDQIVGTGTVGVGMVLPVADATALVGNFDGAYTTEEAWRATGYLGLVYSF